MGGLGRPGSLFLSPWRRLLVKNFNAQNFGLVLIGGVALGLGLAFAKDLLGFFGDEA